MEESAKHLEAGKICFVAGISGFPNVINIHPVEINYGKYEFEEVEDIAFSELLKYPGVTGLIIKNCVDMCELINQHGHEKAFELSRWHSSSPMWNINPERARQLLSETSNIYKVVSQDNEKIIFGQFIHLCGGYLSLINIKDRGMESHMFGSSQHFYQGNLDFRLRTPAFVLDYMTTPDDLKSDLHYLRKNIDVK
jgi:hypothetical protein